MNHGKNDGVGSGLNQITTMQRRHRKEEIRTQRIINVALDRQFSLGFHCGRHRYDEKQAVA